MGDRRSGELTLNFACLHGGIVHGGVESRDGGKSSRSIHRGTVLLFRKGSGRLPTKKLRLTTGDRMLNTSTAFVSCVPAEARVIFGRMSRSTAHGGFATATKLGLWTEGHTALDGSGSVGANASKNTRWVGINRPVECMPFRSEATQSVAIFKIIVLDWPRQFLLR